MKTKKIIAESMPLALKKVRQELGENAIIVNTRTIKTGGLFGFFSKQKFEVTAYTIEKGGDTPAPSFLLDKKEKVEKPFPKNNNEKTIPTDVKTNNSGFHKQPQKLYSYYSQQPAKEEQKVSASASSVDHENPLLDEMQHLRKMMMTFMMSDKQRNALPAGVTKWVDRLKEQGVDDDLTLYIVNCLLKKDESLTTLNDEAIKQEILTIMVEILTKRIPETNTVSEQTRIINMIGPTGVGKTTTIAKLATEQILKQKRRVAMITTDVYRVAAVEQLKTYAGILNVPIEVVRSKEELVTVLDKLKHYDVIYMDTTGRNYKDPKYRESIYEFLDQPLESDNYLVLSLTTKFEDIKILLDEFLDSPIKKLILTKFDETSSYGSILNIAYQYPYKIAYITNGQSVPEDITKIDAVLLASYLLGEDKENGSSTNPSQLHGSI